MIAEYLNGEESLLALAETTPSLYLKHRFRAAIVFLFLGECDFVAWFCFEFFCGVALVYSDLDVIVASDER